MVIIIAQHYRYVCGAHEGKERHVGFGRGCRDRESSIIVVVVQPRTTGASLLGRKIQSTAVVRVDYGSWRSAVLAKSDCRRKSGNTPKPEIAHNPLPCPLCRVRYRRETLAALYSFPLFDAGAPCFVMVQHMQVKENPTKCRPRGSGESGRLRGAHDIPQP